MFLTSHHYIFGNVLVVGILFILGLYLDPVNAYYPQEFCKYIYYYVTFVLLFGMQSLDFSVTYLYTSEKQFPAFF